MSETPKYYITRGRNQSGPYTNSELRRKAATGSLLPTDLIFKDGMSEWVKAKQVKGLFPVEQQKPILETIAEDFEPEYSVDNSHEFEETEKKSFVSKAKSFIIFSIVICGFLIFLITMSLSIVTTKEQRLEFAKKVEQQRLEREKRSIEEAKIKTEKDLIAKKQSEVEAARNPKPVNPRNITKDEWKAIFEKAIRHEKYDVYSDIKLIKIFGKPSRTQTISDRKYKYYECTDGTIQIRQGETAPLYTFKDKEETYFIYELNDF